MISVTFRDKKAGRIKPRRQLQIFITRIPTIAPSRTTKLLIDWREECIYMLFVIARIQFTKNVLSPNSAAKIEIALFLKQKCIMYLVKQPEIQEASYELYKRKELNR